MKFSKLAYYCERIENTSSRLEITRILADLFKQLNHEEIDKTVYLLQGRVAPLFRSLEFGVAEKMLLRAADLVFRTKKGEVEKMYKKIGDVGQTVEIFKKQYSILHQEDLSINQVYDVLYKIAITSGEGSQDKKINLLAQLIGKVNSLSARYISRIPLAILRLGFSDMTVLDAYSWMLVDDKTLRPRIEKAYHVRPDLGFIGKIIKEKGISSLDKIHPVLFTPILMMKAERMSSAQEIITQIGKCAVEPKYDGFRLQIHYSKSNNEVRLYSRSLEEVSRMYPDLIEGVKKELVKVDEIIFEGEAIGFDPRTGNFLPFQETVQRKRKYNIQEKSKEIPLKFFAFELLYLNGKNYLGIDFEERRRTLVGLLLSTGDLAKGVIMITPETTIDEAKKLELIFDDAVSRGLEGVLAKKLNGTYQPGARGWNWIKYKRSYSSKIEDTIDCLVMGYDFGKGKRTSFGIGAFLVGVYDEKKDKFMTVAKIGTGLEDVEWKELKKRADKYKTKKQPVNYEVDKQMSVDIWINPSIVVEIKADEITRSPVHTAGRILKPSKSGSAFEVEEAGYALRFPRLVHFRDDKRPDDVTNLSEVGKMYRHE